MATRPPLWLLREAHARRKRNDGPEEVGLRCTRQGKDYLGRRLVQARGYLPG